MAPNMASIKDTTIYFGYGSNLWLHQMDQRCPTSKYLGVARLNSYKWIINDRGYANVVEVKCNDNDNANTTSEPADNDVVYGLVYTLSPTDESRLDRNEGVPVAYTKEYLACDFWPVPSPGKPTKIDVTKPCDSSPKMLVYIDRKRVTPDEPKKEYVYRMNQGIKDALDMGVPKEYVDGVMRKYIPEPKEGEKERRSMEEFARSQAVRFKDESGVFE